MATAVCLFCLFIDSVCEFLYSDGVDERVVAHSVNMGQFKRCLCIRVHKKTGGTAGSLETRPEDFKEI
jgi:hypothetical protein